MTFSFVIVRNIAITTLKFVNKVGAKIWDNVVLEFKQGTEKRFLDWKKKNFYIVFW